MTTTSGLSGNDSITGTSGSDKLIGGAGDDTLDGGTGSDFINAGGGNDTIIYDEADYKILGGGGIDTLWFLGYQQKLNLSATVVNGIEKLWLDGGGGHLVTLTAADVIRISDTDQMEVIGTATDRLAPGSGWSFAGLSANGQSQILKNGMATLIVSLPVFVEGFSGNAAFQISGFNSLTEDSPAGVSTLTAVGTIVVNDPNAGQAMLLGGPTAIGSPVGTLSITMDQAATLSSPAVYSYLYTISNDAVQKLGAGKTLTDSFNIKALDGSIQQMNFVTSGVNDPAVIGIPSAASVTEDHNVAGGLLEASGTISIMDIDDNEAALNTSVTSANGNLGSLTLNAGGSYTYNVLNSAVQYLKTGTSKLDTFTIFALDGTTKDIVFTINGANDPAVIGNPTAASVTEDVSVVEGLLKATGTISISDADDGQAAFKTSVTSAAGNLGSLVLSANGSYTYSVLNSAVQYLTAGVNKTDTFTVTATDGTTKDIVFTINGANDPAVIGNPTVASVTEDVSVVEGLLKATGTISISDADDGQAAFKTSVTSAAGNLGSLVLSANGSYTYSVLNSAVQYLKTGVNKTDTFTVTATDGTTKDIVFTIFGADDEILGDSGNNIINGTEGPDVIRGKGGNDTINGLGGNDFLYGDEGDDILQGGDGADLLDGGPGNDDMVGGSGNDNYYVDSLGDKVTEGSAGGKDTVFSSMSFTLPSFVEDLMLTGNGNINGIGNSLNNTIDGNSGDNLLVGGGGYDIINGGAGNDTIVLTKGQGGQINGGDGLDLIEFHLPQGSQLSISGGNDSDAFKFYRFDPLATGVSAATLIGFDANRDPSNGGDQLFLQGLQSDYSFFFDGKDLGVKDDVSGQLLLKLVGVFVDPNQFSNSINVVYFT